jgi:uncharacterized protein YjbJ (UPF0337 family)
MRWTRAGPIRLDPPPQTQPVPRALSCNGSARFFLRTATARRMQEPIRSSCVHSTADCRNKQSKNVKESDMSWDRIEGNWKQFKGKVQQQWGSLTNDDLDVVEGNRKELAGRIQQRYGVAKDEAEKQIDDWLTRVN